MLAELKQLVNSKNYNQVIEMKEKIQEIVSKAEQLGYNKGFVDGLKGEYKSELCRGCNEYPITHKEDKLCDECYSEMCLDQAQRWGEPGEIVEN